MERSRQAERETEHGGESASEGLPMVTGSAKGATPACCRSRQGTAKGTCRLSGVPVCKTVESCECLPITAELRLLSPGASARCACFFASPFASHPLRTAPAATDRGKGKPSTETM